MTDLELAARAKAGDGQAVETLVRRYLPLAYGIAGDYFVAGADTDDVRQEALIGLESAVRTYDPVRGSFPAFARLAITRRVLTAVKTGRRGKNLMLASSLRVVTDDDGEEIDAVALARAPHGDPAEALDEREQIRDLVARIKRLSPLERQALVGVCFEGRGYSEIEGLPAGTPAKRIDNAIARARRRLREAA